MNSVITTGDIACAAFPLRKSGVDGEIIIKHGYSRLLIRAGIRSGVRCYIASAPRRRRGLLNQIPISRVCAETSERNPARQDRADGGGTTGDRRTLRIGVEIERATVQPLVSVLRRPQRKLNIQIASAGSETVCSGALSNPVQRSRGYYRNAPSLSRDPITDVRDNQSRMDCAL